MLSFGLVFVLLVVISINVLVLAQINPKRGFDSEQAVKSVSLSSVAYCGTSKYSSYSFTGVLSGFQYSNTISDLKTDTEGFIGYLPADNSIYISFRGSSTIRNWITNIDAVKSNYTSFPDCNCMVHKGFYEAEQKVFPLLLKQVKVLKAKNPTASIKVTGHSLGAALAQLTAMDLIKEGLTPTLYNFGQPRVGDSSYAAFASKTVNTWRITHNKDIVPHTPPIEMGFAHACTEEFEDGDGVLKTCDSSCEDTTCSMQYKIKETNVDDHLLYLGVPLGGCPQ